MATDEQKRSWNLNYESKFKKFYSKFQLHTGNIKERLLDNIDHMEYAYSLSQSEGIPDDTKEKWNLLWLDLMSKTSNTGMAGTKYTSNYFTLMNTIHRKRYKSLEKYLVFFLEEYDRITNRI